MQGSLDSPTTAALRLRERVQSTRRHDHSSPLSSRTSAGAKPETSSGGWSAGLRVEGYSLRDSPLPLSPPPGACQFGLCPGRTCGLQRAKRRAQTDGSGTANCLRRSTESMPRETIEVEGRAGEPPEGRPTRTKVGIPGGGEILANSGSVSTRVRPRPRSI